MSGARDKEQDTGQDATTLPFLEAAVQCTEMWEPQEMGIQDLDTYPHLIRRPSEIV